MQSPDPGISLANMFSSRAPATPAAAPPRRADGPSFEDSLADVSDRSDKVEPSDRPTRAERLSREETASRVEPKEKPREPEGATNSTNVRNDTNDVQQRHDDQASSYARARLLIAEPVTNPQEPIEIAPAIDPQPIAEVGKNLKPVSAEFSNPDLPDTGSESDEPLFHIQPWPLDSTTDEPITIQPIVSAESAAVEPIATETVDFVGDDLVKPIESELADESTINQTALLPQNVDGEATLLSNPAATVSQPTPAVATEPVATTTDRVVPTDRLVLTGASQPTPAVAGPQVITGERPLVQESAAVAQPAQQQTVASSIQPDQVNQVSATKPTSDVPVLSETQFGDEGTEFAPEQYEARDLAATDVGDQRSFAESVKRAEAATETAPPVPFRSPQVSASGSVRDVTSTPQRALNAAMAASGIAVTAVEEPRDGNSAGTGTQDFNAQAFSSLLEAQATQTSRGQRVAKQVEVNPTQFAEMPGEIVARARNLADNETAELEIQLDPPELGQLKIQLRRVDGEVAARITVTDPAAFDLLQTELQELRENLQQSDVAFSSVDVEQDQSSRQSFDREQSGSFAREDSEPATRETNTPQQAGSSQQTIDIRV